MTNEEFEKAIKKYHYIMNKWYYKIKRRVKINKEMFISEFYYILFKSLLKYNHNKKPFINYLNASMKKMFITYIRKERTNKRKQEFRYVDAFNLDSVDNTYSFDKQIEIQDIIHFCQYILKDHGVVELKYGGFTIEEICKILNITYRQYKQIMDRIQQNSEINEVLK